MQHINSLDNFASRHALNGLSRQTLEDLYNGVYRIDKAQAYLDFHDRLENSFTTHPAFTSPPYIHWFASTQLSMAEVRHFMVQFSVLTSQFLVAQLQKTINAPTFREMCKNKRELVNELGVTYGDHESPSTHSRSSGFAPTSSDHGSTCPTLGVYSEGMSQFELLVDMGKPFGLDFPDLGKRSHGTPSTLFFCDVLIKLYGNPNPLTVMAATITLEKWFSADFWNLLTQGFKNYQKRTHTLIPLTYLSSRALEQEKRAAANKSLLEIFYLSHEIDEQQFLNDTHELLNSVHIFWRGLEDDRKRSH